MALTAATLERALRRLLAMEVRIDRLTSMIATVKQGNFGFGDVAIGFSAGQKSAMSGGVSAGVVALEEVVAGLEAEVRGTTTIVPGPAGPGITDLRAAWMAVAALGEESAGRGLRGSLVEDLGRNLSVDRDVDGELTTKAVGAEALALARQSFEVRVDKVKLALGQLRGLGA